ncbi:MULTISPECIES: STAS domain-containing protein [Prauserella salsuginis group]|uniref:Anti-sigma factor antagonist n=2 Tax=Prauserella salsuginis group TaxID=2893672 RepID=A0A839XNA5_9PSEU|nr:MULTISPECIES: STAS domain-containing protein [Prauserella salsuginis group]MBB3663369.1 stage II sporulation protein AA (anti-sigma F factor antagonist) [Prauserella sediminis]MCR3720804.1 stage II sporulation protein AA (anti-sigma F factor antagonist) [Prauserella flava]MCR3735115.1 stage II sporulation protein AA (anti-sigma F factor antagonist) [Prauserella salsuginis]
MTVAHVELRRDTESQSVEITVTGEIDLSNAEQVRSELYGAIANNLIRVSLDLTGVSYLDSSGLRILFTLADRLQRMQTELDIVAPPRTPVRRIVELAGFDAVATLRP